MKRNYIGAIIGIIFGVIIVVFFGGILGGGGPAWLGAIYPFLVFPLSIFGYIVGGIGNVAGGFIIGAVLTIATWGVIGYYIERFLK